MLLLPFGCPHGIRKVLKFHPNKINDLRAENVGFQTLSLRHFTSANSLTASESVEIPLVSKGFGRGDRTSETATKPKIGLRSPSVSFRPDFSENRYGQKISCKFRVLKILWGRTFVHGSLAFGIAKTSSGRGAAYFYAPANYLQG